MNTGYKDIIRDKDYYDISNFIEKLYLEGECLIILMARKFFSLFMLFNDVNKKRYEELEIEYEGNSKIVTHIALPLLENDIRAGKYKKIIIADDIIIHGRSIMGIYRKITGWNKNCEVRITSFLCNNADMRYYEEVYSQVESRYFVEQDYWKKMSTKIVDAFYMTGRPYLSYLPYFTITDKWETLLGKLDPKDCHIIDNEAMQHHSVEGILYTGKLLEKFDKLKFSLISALRLYYYKRINRIVIIPYFCMDMIENDSLRSVSEYLRTEVLEKEYEAKVRDNDDAEDMRIMELEYVLSYWMAKFAVDKLGLHVDCWNYDVEYYSFVMQLISHDIFNDEGEIFKHLDAISGIKVKKIRKLIKNDDIEELISYYEEQKKDYSDSYPTWNQKIHLNQKMQLNQGKDSYERRFIEELLYSNGQKDEERANESEMKPEKNNRLLGIPLKFLLNDSAKYFEELEEDKSKSYKGKVFAEIISAADSGKGSIFTRRIQSKRYRNKCQYGTLLHAGEQNYVFMDNYNFPAMYALYLIEQFDDKTGLIENKNSFINDFQAYLDQKNIFYDKEEMQQLAGTDISSKYGKYLQFVYYRHQENETLKEAINKALVIVAGIRNGKQSINT